MKSKLPRDILSLVNRKSHAAGLAYAELEKKRLIAELERLRAEGKDVKVLHKYLDETAPLNVCSFS